MLNTHIKATIEKKNSILLKWTVISDQASWYKSISLEEGTKMGVHIVVLTRVSMN